MKSTKAFKRTLINLKKTGLSLDSVVSENGIKIGSIYLSIDSDPLAFQAASTTSGVLLPRSSKELRESLHAKGINYLDLNGNVFLKLSSYEILIEKKKTKRNSSFIQNP